MNQQSEHGSNAGLLQSMIQDEVAAVRARFEDNYGRLYPGYDSILGSYYGNNFIRDLKLKEKILVQMVSDLDPIHRDHMPMENWRDYLGCGSIPTIRRGKHVWGPACGNAILCPKCAKKAAADRNRSAIRRFFKSKPDGKAWAVTLRLPEGHAIDVMDKRLRQCLERLVAMISNHRKPRSKPHASWAIKDLSLWWEVAWGGNRVNPHFHGILLTEGREGDMAAVSWIRETWNLLAKANCEGDLRMRYPELCLIEPIEMGHVGQELSSIRGVFQWIGYSTEKVGRAAGGLLPDEDGESNIRDILAYSRYLSSRPTSPSKSNPGKTTRPRHRCQFHRHFANPPVRPTEERVYRYDPPASMLSGLGIPSLRPGQSEAIARLLAGQDVLADLPTAYGKTTIPCAFGLERQQSKEEGEVSAMVMVVPLVALARAHASYFRQRGYRVIHWQGRKTSFAIDRETAASRPLLVILCPESVRTFERWYKSGGMPYPDLVIYDEAHCLVDDGHDYRPMNLVLARFFSEWFQDCPWLYLTATPSPVLQQSLTKLRGRNPTPVRVPHSRPNIRLELCTVPSENSDESQSVSDALMDAVLDQVPVLAQEGKTLVFCDNKKWIERLVPLLRSHLPEGIRVEGYHAEDHEWQTSDVGHRVTLERDFIENRIGVLVSTRAFAMGIDVPDLTRMLFVWPPESIRLFYQMVGRLGRQGQPSKAVLLHHPGKINELSYMFRANTPDEKTTALVAMALKVMARPADAVELTGLINDRSEDGPRLITPRGSYVGLDRIKNSLVALERSGFLKQSGERTVFYLLHDEWKDRPVDDLVGTACRLFASKTKDWERMRSFANRFSQQGEARGSIPHDKLLNAMNGVKRRVCG